MKFMPLRLLFVITLVMGLSLSVQADKKQKYDFLGPTGILGVRDAKVGIKVDGVEPGSPADGTLKKGDVIVAISGRSVMGNDRSFQNLLAEVIDQTESEEAGGKLPVTLKDGRELTLHLEVLGSFSPTAPYNCPKTDKLIDMAADGLVSHLAKAKRKQLGASHTNTELLGLMATGEKKYMEAAYRIIREDYGPIPYDGQSLQSKTDKQVGTWATAYATIAMAEYYLLTKDKTIWPALQTYTLSLAEGQDAAGLYGHKMASPIKNRAPGYGQMNNVSLACFMAMLLAEKCGIEVPGLDQAISRTMAYVKYHEGKGGFAYGFHGPREWEWNNNGTSAMAAICMAIAGDLEAARFFAASTAASYESLGKGHASTLFSTYWTPAGAHVLGAEVTQQFFPKTHFYFTPRRKWDGSIEQCYKEGHFGGVVLLAYCLPRRALVITGRDTDESLWVDATKARSFIEMGAYTAKDKSPDALLDSFGHMFPQVRSQAVSEFLGKVSGKRFENLKIKSPKAAESAVQSIRDVFPELKAMATTGNKFEKINAVRSYLLVCPEDKLDKRMADLAQILRNIEEPNDLRLATVKQLITQGKACKPYFNDILNYLMEERSNDHFAEVDAQIAEAIDPLARELEWDFYKAGFVTDKVLFHEAANRLMDHRRQNARGTGVRMVRFVPQDSFHRVARQLDHILRDDDKAYHTYHNAQAAIDPAVKIFADHNVLEGVGYLVDYMIKGGGKGSFKMRMLTSSLPAYGVHAKPVLPRVIESDFVQVMYAQAENNGGHHRFLPAFEKMIAEIEAATDGPPLLPLDQVIQRSKRTDKALAN